jgi:hypothetical protein
MGALKAGKDNCTALCISVLLLCAGSAFGWAVVFKLVGAHESISFLKFAGFSGSVIFASQLLAFFASNERLIRRLLFLAMFGLSLIWPVLCLFLPIFWIGEIGLFAKITIATFAILLFFANAVKGFRSFDKCWDETLPPLSKYYKSRGCVLDWEKLMASLHLSASIFIPGAPKWVESALSVFLVLSMIIGLNLRSVFPFFSVCAWGIPCVIGASTLVQMVAMRVAQAVKVAELEKELGVRIKPKLC